MARFIFRLQGLLKLRESRRDECRAALAEAYRVDEALRKQFDALEADLAALRDFCRQKSAPGGVDIDRLVEAQRYELVTRAQQRNIAQQRETVAAEIERRRQTLIEADREVRVLEKLRERQAEQHRREEELRERKRLDEVAAQQTIRKMALAEDFVPQSLRPSHGDRAEPRSWLTGRDAADPTSPQPSPNGRAGLLSKEAAL